MNMFVQVASAARASGRSPPAPARIEVLEPSADRCSAVPSPEGHIKLRNYRLVGDGLRAYTPTGDVNTSPSKGKLVARWEFCADVSPPRKRILELVLPEQPGSDVLEAIVRPAPRRGPARPLDDDARRFLQRTLLSPSPPGLSAAPTPEPTPGGDMTLRTDRYNHALDGTGPSLADELREAEEKEKFGNFEIRETSDELLISGLARDALERERLGRLALSVEQDDSEGDAAEEASEGANEHGGALSAAARHLDALLAESRHLHDELAEIHQDMQVLMRRSSALRERPLIPSTPFCDPPLTCITDLFSAQERRAGQCAAAARALGEESRALRFLDDVVALLRGDLRSAVRARTWPFAFGGRIPERNYILRDECTSGTKRVELDWAQRAHPAAAAPASRDNKPLAARAGSPPVKLQRFKAFQIPHVPIRFSSFLYTFITPNAQRSRMRRVQKLGPSVIAVGTGAVRRAGGRSTNIVSDVVNFFVYFRIAISPAAAAQAAVTSTR
ncbi:hypothetical protein EVAR_8974_1 [Eumeta japonica]|uniref:Uncharacterized protein n=1 Tax=Eumeta variegata TaxID=151549 RepID=A0A4C1WSV4_EUMVA|nr:hypothetical protein EVAR_8974_1 [Eumeta japonica]